MYSSPRRSALLSGLLHAGSIALILLLTRVTNSPVFQPHPVLLAPIVLPDVSVAAPHKNGGGGGGGARDETPPSVGRLPRPSPRQFTPPLLKPIVTNPQLTIEPTLLAPADAQIPTVSLAQFGMPNGVAGPPSQGPGAGGGFGSGKDGGFGDNEGPGFGTGAKGGIGGPGEGGSGGTGAIVGPVLVYKTEPEYSDEARRARVQGLVVLSIEVGVDGMAKNIEVRQSLGMGLDERAIETVRHWRFRPATRNGKPIPVRALVQVTFRLL